MTELKENEKEKFLAEKMEKIKIMNEKLRQRHAEIETDKKNANLMGYRSQASRKTDSNVCAAKADSSYGSKLINSNYKSTGRGRRLQNIVEKQSKVLEDKRLTQDAPKNECAITTNQFENAAEALNIENSDDISRKHERTDFDQSSKSHYKCESDPDNSIERFQQPGVNDKVQNIIITNSAFKLQAHNDSAYKSMHDERKNIRSAPADEEVNVRYAKQSYDRMPDRNMSSTKSSEETGDNSDSIIDDVYNQRHVTRSSQGGLSVMVDSYTDHVDIGFSPKVYTNQGDDRTENCQIADRISSGALFRFDIPIKTLRRPKMLFDDQPNDAQVVTHSVTEDVCSVREVSDDEWVDVLSSEEDSLTDLPKKAKNKLLKRNPKNYTTLCFHNSANEDF